MNSSAKKLLTVPEYLELSDSGFPRELVRGLPVELSWQTPRQGEICGQIYYLLREYLKEHPAGRAVTNDAAVLTEQDPDTVRGADVAYYSYERVPAGPMPNRYLDVAPELVFEVRSITDRWTMIHGKVAEYLKAGVKIVCVLDEQTHTASVFCQDAPPSSDDY